MNTPAEIAADMLSGYAPDQALNQGEVLHFIAEAIEVDRAQHDEEYLSALKHRLDVPGKLWIREDFEMYLSDMIDNGDIEAPADREAVIDHAWDRKHNPLSDCTGEEWEHIENVLKEAIKEVEA